MPSGEGGTISVLNLMTELYASGKHGKNAQILATGAAGPGSNEHGTNENLDMAYTRQLACALAQMIMAASHAALIFLFSCSRAGVSIFCRTQAFALRSYLGIPPGCR